MGYITELPMGLPLSLRERADERGRLRSPGEGKRELHSYRFPLTPRMNTCVGPLPRGEGLRTASSKMHRTVPKMRIGFGGGFCTIWMRRCPVMR